MRSTASIFCVVIAAVLLSCSDNIGPIPGSSPTHKDSTFTRDDIPISRGTYWKFRVGSTSEPAHFVILRIERVEQAGNQTAIHYRYYEAQESGSSAGAVIDSALGILTDTSFTYSSKQDLSNQQQGRDAFLGDYRLKLPIEANNRWVSMNPLDTLRFMLYVDRIEKATLPNTKIFYLYSAYQNELGFRGNGIYLSKGIGVINKAFRRGKDSTYYDGKLHSLIDYYIK